MTDRTISSCSHKFSTSNCKKCGIYLHSSDLPIKTNYYDSYLNCSSNKYLKHMRKRIAQPLQAKQIHQSTYNLLQSICDKFQYSLETLTLGIYLYGKISKNHDKDQKFWASVCLIGASKGIQLDKRVPYLNRYQRYAQKNFSQEDYQLGQKTIMQQLNFDIQYSTFLSFLNFYLTNGVIFKSDCINSSILKYVQDDMIQKAKDYIKTGQFITHNPQKLALSIIKQIRIKFRLQPWKKQLEIISGYLQEDIKIIEKTNINILKPLVTINTISHKPRQKLSNLSLGPIPINSLQMSLNLTQQKIKTNKKKYQSTIKFQSTMKILNIKQNSNKIRDQLPLNTLRNQNLSTNKYMNGLFLANSDKIIPLNSFITKRM